MRRFSQFALFTVVSSLLLVHAAARAQTNLGSVSVGKSATSMVTIKFSAAGTVSSIAVLTQGTSGLDFTNAGTGTCKVGTTYSAAQTCTVAVTFKPAFAGSKSGAVVLHSSTEVIATNFLTGTGTGPQIAFNPSPAVTFAPQIQSKTGPEGLINPLAVAVDGSGTQYIATPNISGIVVLPAGSSSAKVLDPVVNGSRVDEVSSVFVDGAGDIFMDDGSNSRVVEVRPDGSYLEFFDPYSTNSDIGQVTVDWAGDVFITNRINPTILEYPGGNNEILPIQITPTQSGQMLGDIRQIAVDTAGNLVMTNPFTDEVVELTAAEVQAGGGEVTVIAATLATGSFIPEGLAFDGIGDLYIVDAENYRVVVLPPGTTMPLTTNPLISITPVVSQESIGSIYGIAVDGAGDLYITDSDGGRVVKVLRQQTPAESFKATPIGTKSPDSPHNVQIQNIGTAPLTFTEVAYPADFPAATGGADLCEVSTVLNRSQICNLNIDFMPTAGATFSESVTLKDNTLNVAGTQQNIVTTGTGDNPLLSASSLAFGGQEVGTESASQQVSLTNTTATTLRIPGIQVTGANASSFVFGSNCPSTLASGAACTIHGHFAPTTTGPLTATLLVIDSATGSPQSISLTGTGEASSAISLSASNLAFGGQNVGSESASQQVILTNTTGTTLRIVGIQVTGTNASSFVFGSNCPSSMANGAACTIHGHFAPTTTGPLTAAVTIIDSATGSPQSITLTGTGDARPAISLSANSFSFGLQQVGTQSASQQLTLTNTGGSALSVVGITVTGTNASSFVFGSNCPSSLAAGASCIIHGHFAPTGTGAMTAALLIVDNASTSPQMVSLTGTGN
jgi:hypothetical protein